MFPMWSRCACDVTTAFTLSVEYPSFWSCRSMTSSRFWLGLRKSQLPAAQCALHLPSEIALLLPVSKTTSPFGWSMTHMLIGMVTSRAFSFGTVGISPVMLNGPKKPLEVQNTFTWGAACVSPEDGRSSVIESDRSAATIPSLFMIPLLRGRPRPRSCTTDRNAATIARGPGGVKAPKRASGDGGGAELAEANGEERIEQRRRRDQRGVG